MIWHHLVYFNNFIVKTQYAIDEHEILRAPQQKTGIFSEKIRQLHLELRSSDTLQTQFSHDISISARKLTLSAPYR